MRYGKLIKVGIVLAGVLTSTLVFAAQDPVSVKLTSALTSPIVVGTATPTTYTLTNNLPFALTPTFTTNSAAYVVSSSTCNNVASKTHCQVIATYTPSSVSTPAPLLAVNYGTTRIPLTQTPTIVSTPAPGSLTLTATPTTLNFTAPNVAQSMTFQTSPATADVVISVSNLPSGVSSASSCTTASTGSCSVTFTANSSAYGNKTLTVSSSAVKTPPVPTISVANTTLSVADTSYMAASGTLSVTLTNTGNFAWQTDATNAVQVTGSNVTEFGVDLTNCTASNVAPGSTCNVSFTTTGANAGDGVNIVVGSNATQSGNGNVYINGGGDGYFKW